MLVHPPEMEVQSRGEDCKDRELEIMQHGEIGGLEEQRCEDVRHREQETPYIIECVMIHQDNI